MEKHDLFKHVEANRQQYQELALFIADNPELGHREFMASTILADTLKEQGFVVEKPLAGLETAFCAHYRGKRPGPVIALLAEYDALPEIGHWPNGGPQVRSQSISLSSALQLPIIVAGNWWDGGGWQNCLERPWPIL